MQTDTKRPIDALLEEYGESHMNKTNKMIHWFAVPCIFLSVVGIIWSIPTPKIVGLEDSNVVLLNWSIPALILTLIYYSRLSIPLTIGMAAFTIVCMIIVERYEAMGPTSLWLACVIIFVIGWIFQFIGHKIEGKKPSFFRDVQFLLIGPAWLMSFLFNHWNIRY